MVEVAFPDPATRAFVHVKIGDWIIPRENWPTVRPKVGNIVTAVVLPAGGNVLRIALTIAVIAIATYATAGIATPWLGAAVGASITIGGMLAINALIPPPQPKLEDQGSSSATNYSLAGGTNRARIEEPILRVLGFHRVAPDLAAPWVTDIEGDNVFLRGLLCWGFGPLEISNIKIGDTPIGEYDDVQLETVPGTPETVAQLSLYATTVLADKVQAKLTKATGFVSRTTAAGIDRAVVELALPAGGIKYGKKTGDRISIHVQFNIEWRRVGDANWNSTGTFDIGCKTTSTVRRTKEIVFPGPPGRFEIRVRRTTDDIDQDDNEENRVDESWWISLRSHRQQNPVLMPGLCLTAIRIKASEQLTGTIDNLNGLAKSIGWEWQPGLQQWLTVPTNKPHAIFRLVLQGLGAKRPASDDDLDLDGLESWGEYCADKAMTCNYVVDSAVSTWDLLRLVAATGRAAPTCATGQWSVIVDRERDPVQHFTPRNILKGSYSGERLYVDMPHGLRARFMDETRGFAQTQRIVYMDGYDESNAFKLESVEFPGVTNPEQVQRLGRFRLAEAQLRPETHRLATDFEWLSCTRGDRVTVAHDVIESAVGSGRIKQLVQDGDVLTAIVLDEKIVLQPSRRHVVLVRSAGARFEWSIRGSGETDTLELEEPSGLPAELTVFDLATVVVPGIGLLDCLIRGIAPGKDMSAQLTLVPYAPGVFRSDSEEIPPWKPAITSAAGTFVPLVASVRSGEMSGKRNADGSLLVQVVVRLFDDGSRPTILITDVQLRWREQDSGAPWRYLSFPAEARELVIVDAEAEANIELAVRYRFESGRAGKWTAVERHHVIGPTIPPPDIVSAYFDGDRISWPAPVPLPADLAGYMVRWSSSLGSTWDNAIPVNEGILTEPSISAGAIPFAAKELLVVAVTTAGLVSRVPARVEVTPEVLLDRPTWIVRDLREEGFPGALVGCEVDADGRLRSLDTTKFFIPGASLFIPSSSNVNVGNTGGVFAPGVFAPGVFVQVSQQALTVYEPGVYEPGVYQESAQDVPGGRPFFSAAWAAMQYTASWSMPDTLRPGDRIRLDIESEGDVNIWYGWGGDQLTSWPVGDPVTEALYDYAVANPDLPFGVLVDQISSRPFVPQRLVIVPRSGELLRIQVRAAGGAAVRPVVKRLRIVLEGLEVEERLSAVYIYGDGLRLTLTKPFRRIEDILLGPLREDLGSGPGQVVILDKPAGIVAGRSAAGTPVDVIQDLRVIGV